jgi:hypothetical protein
MALTIRIPQQKPSTGTTPMAPRAEARVITYRVEEILEGIQDEVLCRAGCGTTCHPEEFIAGFCSRACMKDLLGFEYD